MEEQKVKESVAASSQPVLLGQADAGGDLGLLSPLGLLDPVCHSKKLLIFKIYFYSLYLIYHNIAPVLCLVFFGIWGLSSPTRDQTHTLCFER